MAFVLDASVAAAWFIPDEASERGDQIMFRILSERAHVPCLFWYEMRSVFLIAEKKGRLAHGASNQCMIQLRALSLVEHTSENDAAVLELARSLAISAYDASYLYLASANDLPLATFDRRLAAAAEDLGAAILEPR